MTLVPVDPNEAQFSIYSYVVTRNVLAYVARHVSTLSL